MPQRKKAHRKQLSPIGKKNTKVLSTQPKLINPTGAPKLKSPLK